MSEGAGFVLVVDDDAVNRLLLTQAWSETAIACGRWRNGLQALRALRDEPFGCVLLDVLMPDMDGYQVLEHIRSNPKLRHAGNHDLGARGHREPHPLHRDYAVRGDTA